MSTKTTEPIRRILLPTDFSPASTVAQAYAERLASCTGASLLVLFVQQSLGDAAALDDSDDQMKDTLEGIRSRDSGVVAEHLVHRGSPGEVICWIAQERECDQIVMGTHGRTGLVNLLMGSTAEYVVRHARCPVLTVPSRPSTEEPLTKPNVSQEMPRIQSL